MLWRSFGRSRVSGAMAELALFAQGVQGTDNRLQELVPNTGGYKMG